MINVRKSLIIITIITLIYGLYYKGIPKIVNLEKHSKFIETKINQKTGFNVKIDKPYFKMGLSPAVWLMAEHFDLKDNDNNSLILLKHCAIKIKLLPLLFKNIEISNFSADYAAINFVYTKNDELKFGQYDLTKMPPTKMNLNKAYFRIIDYDVKLQDLKQNKTIFLDGNYLILDEFKRNKHLKLSTDAKLFVDQKHSDLMADIDINLPINKITENQFKLNGHITNLDLSDFSEYAQAFSENKIKEIYGKINLYTETLPKQNRKSVTSKVTLENIGIIQEKPEYSISCGNKITVLTSMETITNGLLINSADIKSDGIDISVNGTINKLDSKYPNINTNIAINNSQIDKFIPILPPIGNVNGDVSFIALKQNRAYGDIKGFLNLKGKFNEPDVNGKILVNNVWLNEPFINNTPKATVKLSFVDKKLFMDIDVPAPIKQKVKVNGSVELYGEKIADIIIKSTSEVDLKTTQKVLNPLHEILLFNVGPVPIMDISGKGNIDLHVIGTKQNPRAWGNFNFDNATASFLDINNIILTKGSGSLAFNDEDTHFITKEANINNKPVKIDGTCSVKGVLDFKVNTKNQDLSELYKAIQTSPMLIDIQNQLKPVSMAKGLTDIELNLTGTVPDVNDIVFNKNLFAKGNLNLRSSSIVLKGLPLSDINGQIKINNFNTILDLISKIGTSNLKITGKLDDTNANLKIASDKFILKDGLDALNISIPYKNEIGSISSNFNASYNGKIDKIEIPAINIKGKINPINKTDFTFNGANFELNNAHLKTSNMKGQIQQNPYFISLNITNLLGEKQSVNTVFDIKNFNLKNLNGILSQVMKSEILTDFSGIINLKGQIKNNEIFSDINLENLSFTYKPDEIKTEILNGKLQFKNSMAILNKINMKLENMPVSIDGKIFNINSKTPNLKIYVTAKPTQDFIEQIFNKNSLYPVKIKGNIDFTSQITGSADALKNYTTLNLGNDASIYYMGATLENNSDDDSTEVKIIADNILTKNSIKLNDFKYDKIKQNAGESVTKNHITASGSIKQLNNNDFLFENFKIKTQVPTDARVFNIIFRKPLMKQGKFTSDITINGKAFSPVIHGKLNVKEIDMPVLDATIKDVDFDFKKDKVYLNSTGTVLTNNLKISAILKNSFNLPLIFDSIKIDLEDLNINKIVQAFRDYDVSSTQTKNTASTQQLPNISQITIRSGEMRANKIKVKELEASDFMSHFSLNNKMIFNIDNFSFKMAQGDVEGSVLYNLLNNMTQFAMHVDNTNAQIISETLFDIKGQIFGLVTGDINLTCNGKSNDTCTQTLNGKATFSVRDGRMPKLGSLEYLLKAGNLVKGGLTGLSINGIIDLITPYKTGDFESITGYFTIKDGLADDIKIYSAGNTLNMYLRGSYNLNNMVADMQIFGALTKNFSTLMGKIGNASLKHLLNTIPGINISESPAIITDDIENIPNTKGTNSRMFNAEIYGDINGNDYVKNFKWLK